MSRVMIITGCASGIGKEVANRLVAQGDKLIVCDLEMASLERAAKEYGWLDNPSVRLEAFDVRDADRWQQVVERAVSEWGRLDVLINVAGMLQVGYIQDTDTPTIDRTIDVNAKGVIYGIRAASRSMIRQRSGHIVNVASLAGVAPTPGLSVYSASKHAARGASLSCAAELQQHGVSVTVVCPDLVDTGMLDAQIDREEAALSFSGPRPLTVDEVADAIVGPVLRDKPYERLVTPNRSRSSLLRLASAFPQAAIRLREALQKRGTQNQSKVRGDKAKASGSPGARS